jgi:hypothetical protein
MSIYLATILFWLDFAFLFFADGLLNKFHNTNSGQDAALTKFIQKQPEEGVTIELTISQDNCPSDSRFSRIQDVEVDSRGNIYILDNFCCQIWKLDAQGKYLLSFGGSGRGKSKFAVPTDLLIDRQDYLYVLDSGNKRVSKFNPVGTFIENFKLDIRESLSDLKGAVGPCDQLILSYFKDNKIFHVYDAKGNLLRSFGELGRPPLTSALGAGGDIFFTATSLFCAGEFLLCTHPFNYEIRKYEVVSGKLISSFGRNLPFWESPILHQMKNGYALETHVGTVSTLVSLDGKILNFISQCAPNVRCRYFLDAFDKDGNFLGHYETGYYATSIDKNGKIYCIPNNPPWRVIRCAITINVKSTKQSSAPQRRPK